MTSTYDRAVLLSYLQQVPTFCACTERQLEHLLDLSEIRAFESGTQIVKEGDVGDEFFLVAQGDVEVVRRGREVAKLGAGGFFGELGLFEDAPRNATVRAVTPTSTAVLARARFADALETIPPLRDALLRGMARRLRELDARG
jgi:CRP-like cAMP-binding protein